MKTDQSNYSALAEYHFSSQATEELSESIKFFPQVRILRTLGSVLQQIGVTEYELKVSDNVYTVIGPVAKEIATPRSLLQKMFGFAGIGNKLKLGAARQLRYSITDLLDLETEGRERRKESSQMPDPYSTAQILRGVGFFLDKRKGSRLLGVTVKDRWVAIDYVTADGRAQKEKQDFEYFYDYWVKMYMQRSTRTKFPPPSDPTLYVTWESGLRQHKLSRDPA